MHVENGFRCHKYACFSMICLAKTTFLLQHNMFSKRNNAFVAVQYVLTIAKFSSTVSLTFGSSVALCSNNM